MGAVTFCLLHPHGDPDPKASINGFLVLLQRNNKGSSCAMSSLKTEALQALWLSVAAPD